MKGKSFIRILFALLLTLGSQLRANNIQIGAAASTDTISVGGQFLYRLEARITNGINWPILTDTIGSFEIIEIRDIDTVSQNPLHLKQDFVLTHWDTGFFRIPSIAFTYGSDSLFTQSLDITIVAGVEIPEENVLASIKEPIDIPFGWDDIKKYVYAWFIIAIISAIIIAIYSKLKSKKKKALEEAPKIPAHIIALGELESLKSKELWQNELIKEYYSELSDILRTYVENRYQILAMESTTDEIDNDLKLLLEKEDRQILIEFLSTADLVKFAKANPEKNIAEQYLDMVRRFVLKTKLEEKPKEE